MRTELTSIQRLVDQQDGYLEDLHEALRSQTGVKDALERCISTHKLILTEVDSYARNFVTIIPKAGTPQEDVLDAGQFQRNDADRGFSVGS